MTALFEHLLEESEKIGVFASQVEIPLFSTYGITCNGHTFKEKIGGLSEDNTVLKSSRLTFIGVADDVVRLAFRLAAEAPLHSRGESRPTAAAKAGSRDLVNDIFG